MQFSWKLAFLNTVMEWAESRRRGVQHQITASEIRRLTTGIVIDEEQPGVYSIRNLTSSNLQEISNSIKDRLDLGYGSAFTRMLTDRIDRKVMGTDEAVRP